jgi:hypothetical protein
VSVGTYPRIRVAIHAAATTLAGDQRPPALTAAADAPVQCPADDAADPVASYLRVGEDGTVVVFCTQVELGQGVFTP